MLCVIAGFVQSTRADSTVPGSRVWICFLGADYRVSAMLFVVAVYARMQCLMPMSFRPRYSNEYRQACYDKIVESVERAMVENVDKKNKTTASPTKGNAAHGRKQRAEATIGKQPPLEARFRAQVFEQYSSVEEGWKVFDSIGETPGQLTRSDWKAVLRLLGIEASTKDKGNLRKKLDPSNSKLIAFADFAEFMRSDAKTAGEDGRSSSAGAVDKTPQFAALPSDVAEVPDA